MAVTSTKRRHGDEEGRRPKKKIRVKKQKTYHSSSEEESDEEHDSQRFIARDAPAKTQEAANSMAQSNPKSILKQKALNSKVPAMVESEDDDESGDEERLARNTAINSGAALGLDDNSLGEDDSADGEEKSQEKLSTNGATAEDESSDDIHGTGDDDDEDDDEAPSDLESQTSMTSSQALRAKKKRNDPDAFATSISKILDTKLSSSKRSDPVLSRSKSAAEANQTLSNERLEAKARAQIRAEKKNAMERGRVKDVLGLETEGVDTGAIMEVEKKLKKTAQRGVVKLFNAVRAAQVKAEQAVKDARQQGVVGMRQREEKVNEMSKQGFLDLISSGGKTTEVLS